MKLIEVSEEEKKILIREVAERYKNITYMQAERSATQIVEGALTTLSLDGTRTELTATWSIIIVPHDIIEILGGVRRDKCRDT